MTLAKLPFWIASRTAILLYKLCPLFRPARGAICIIRSGDSFLLIDRNDGLGLCFPGGAARNSETPEAVMKREVQEETGLHIIECTPLYEFHTTIFYPHSTTVFEARAEGVLRPSWEGTPVWALIPEADSRIFRPHQTVFHRLRSELSREAGNAAM